MSKLVSVQVLISWGEWMGYAGEACCIAGGWIYKKKRNKKKKLMVFTKGFGCSGHRLNMIENN